jgi:hypothetical protein
MVDFNLEQKFNDAGVGGSMVLGVAFRGYAPEQMSCVLNETLGFVEVEVCVELTRGFDGVGGGFGMGRSLVPDDGRLELQLCGSSGKMRVQMEYGGSCFQLELTWSQNGLRFGRKEGSRAGQHPVAATVVKYTETDLSNNLLYCYIMVRTCVTDAILGSHLGWHQFFRTHLLARNHAQPTQLPWA